MENVTNPPTVQVTLANDYHVGDGVMHVSAAAPVSENTRILVGSGLYLITSGALTTNWSVSGSIENTTDYDHPAGSGVTFLLTAGGLIQFVADRISSYGYGAVFSLVKPPLTGWTADPNNSGANTFAIDTSVGFVRITEARSSGSGGGGYYRTAPTPPYTMDFLFLPHFENDLSCDYLIGLRQSTTGKIVLADVFLATGSNDWGITFAKWTNATTWSADYTAVGNSPRITALLAASRPFLWIRLRDDNTNLIFSYSTNGSTWRQWDSRSRTDFLTSSGGVAGPDQIFIGLNNNSNVSGTQLGMDLIHLYQSA